MMCYCYSCQYYCCSIVNINYCCNIVCISI